jgi:hypothetical protein
MRHENVWKSGCIYIHVFLTSELVGSCHLHASAALLLGNSPDTYWMGSWVGPQVGMDDMVRKQFCPSSDSNSALLAVQSIASPYSNCAIPTLYKNECKLNYRNCTDNLLIKYGNQFHIVFPHDRDTGQPRLKEVGGIACNILTNFFICGFCILLRI